MYLYNCPIEVSCLYFKLRCVTVYLHFLLKVSCLYIKLRFVTVYLSISLLYKVSCLYFKLRCVTVYLHFLLKVSCLYCVWGSCLLLLCVLRALHLSCITCVLPTLLTNFPIQQHFNKIFSNILNLDCFSMLKITNWFVLSMKNSCWEWGSLTMRHLRQSKCWHTPPPPPTHPPTCG